MNVSSTTALAYWNDRFVSWEEARLPLHDAGFVMGVTVTDMVRTFRHRPFRLAEHVARFRASCAASEVAQGRSDTDVVTLAEQLIEHNAGLMSPESDLALILFATPGAIAYYLGEARTAGEGEPTFGMHTFPLPTARFRSYFTHGASLTTVATRAIPANCIDPRIKHRSRLHWWLAEHSARRMAPGSLAVVCDFYGQVTETASANVLIVKNGTVLTPPDECVLGGISLHVTEELCRQHGIPFQRQALTPVDCHEADEVMITSTPFGLAGVAKWDGATYAWPGPITRLLQQAWNELAGFNLGQQILASR